MFFDPKSIRVVVNPAKTMPDLPKNPAQKKKRKRRKTSKKVLREKAEIQPRNSDGTFAKIGGFLDRVFTRKPARKKRKLPPLPDRNLGGKLLAIANGEAHSFVKKQRSNLARKSSPILREIEPTKRRKRRRRKATN